MERYRVGILGATGAVGQRLVQLLDGHPWFEVTEVVASDRSAGKQYAEAASWRLETPLPPALATISVRPLDSQLECDFLLSGLDSSVAGAAEENFAAAGYPVISNCVNHRMDADVPLLIPEVNPGHLALLEQQRTRRGLGPGFITTNPNCAAIGLTMVLKPLDDAFGVEEVAVVTMQAISGAGYLGVPASAIYDNVIPFIKGEEEKLQSEPLKILGRLEGGAVVPAEIPIDAQCNRVAVLDGHLESVSVRLRQGAELGAVGEALRSFKGVPQQLGLPTAPEHPILVMEEPDRPQPRLDRYRSQGMAVMVGRLRHGARGQLKFTILSHNAIRGAAGAAVLNAELLHARGQLPRRG